MKINKQHSVKVLFLLLLSIALLCSSAGSYYSSAPTKTIASTKEKKSEGGKEETVSIAHSIEAVVVSVVLPDFAKEVLFLLVEFSPSKETVFSTVKNILFSERYFHTLFTNIISPNAP